MENLDLMTPSTLINIYTALHNSLLESEDIQERRALSEMMEAVNMQYHNLTGEEVKQHQTTVGKW